MFAHLLFLLSWFLDIFFWFFPPFLDSQNQSFLFFYFASAPWTPQLSPCPCFESHLNFLSPLHHLSNCFWNHPAGDDTPLESAENVSSEFQSQDTYQVHMTLSPTPPNSPRIRFLASTFISTLPFPTPLRHLYGAQPRTSRDVWLLF